MAGAAHAIHQLLRRRLQSQSTANYAWVGFVVVPLQFHVTVANGGRAYPPDLSLTTKALHSGQNYVFALLTGYRDPPAGVSGIPFQFILIREGLHYNPYFPGGAIAMPKMHDDGAVEYEDGTPATEAQMGKDVVLFLSWVAEPEMEEWKLMGFKWIFVLSLALLQAAYYRCSKWSVLKSLKLVVDVVN